MLLLAPGGPASEGVPEDGLQLIIYLDDWQQAMTAVLDKGVTAVQAAEAKLQASAQQIPRSVPFNVFDNGRSTLSFTLGPVALVLAMLFTGHFSRVPEEELEKVQAEPAQAPGAVQRFQQCRAELAKDRPEGLQVLSVQQRLEAG